MKPVIWIAAALVVIGGGYMWYSGQKTPEQATQTPAASGGDETQPAATTESATEAATGAADDMASLLTLDGFDMEKVTDAIEASDLSTVQKSTLTTGLNQAKDDPELLKGVLDQIKSALGL